MNERIPDKTPDGELPDALRWQLRALRRDAPPTRDLWSGIAARLEPQVAADAAAPSEAPAGAVPATTAPRRRERSRQPWMAPLALAAGVAALAIGLAIGLGGPFRAGPASPSPADGGLARTDAPAPDSGAAARPAPPASLLQREADGMTRQYQAALREIAPAAQNATVLQPAFDELDRNAALILDALAHDPDSRLLLEQLRRTYARRLSLTQRVAYT